MQFYEFLGLEPRLSLDLADLKARFYTLSREWHPDRFSRAAAGQQQQALDNTALLNDAYRILRDPVTRAEYVLKESGFDSGEQRSKDVPPELLEEVFELNMALEELRGGDASARPALEEAQRRFSSMREGLDAQLSSLFRKWDEAGERAVLQQIRALLNKRRYIENLLREAGKELATDSR